MAAKTDIEPVPNEVPETTNGAVENKPVKVEGLVFDFYRLTARAVMEIQAGGLRTGIQKQAEVIAQVCAACPEAWGPPDDPNTFLNLPFYGETGFTAVVRQFIDEMGDPAKAKN